jgi:hypothetical protein
MTQQKYSQDWFVQLGKTVSRKHFHDPELKYLRELNINLMRYAFRFMADNPDSVPSEFKCFQPLAEAGAASGDPDTISKKIDLEITAAGLDPNSPEVLDFIHDRYEELLEAQWRQLDRVAALAERRGVSGLRPEEHTLGECKISSLEFVYLGDGDAYFKLQPDDITRLKDSKIVIADQWLAAVAKNNLKVGQSLHLEGQELWVERTPSEVRRLVHETADFVQVYEDAYELFLIKGHGITGVIQCDRSYPDNEVFWWASIDLDEKMWGVCDVDEPHSANISTERWEWTSFTHGHPAEVYFSGIQSLLVRMSGLWEFFS